MSLSTIVQAVTAAAGDFARHTSSQPPRSYFGGTIYVPGIDEDPCEGVPAHEIERQRLRLIEDSAQRQARTERGLRTGSRAELRRLGLAGVAA